jgi:hypothetical protein
MIEQTSPHDQGRLPPEMLASLLQTVRRRQRSGDLVGARVVLRALAAQQPDDPRIWLALATVVETRDEQHQALARALALDPQNALARRALERFTETERAQGSAQAVANGTSNASMAQPVHTAAPDLAASEPAVLEPAIMPLPDDRPVQAIRWPLYVVIGAAVILVLVVAALQSTLSPVAQAPTPTQMLPGVVGDVQPTLGAAPESPPPVASQAAPAAAIATPVPPAATLATHMPTNPTARPSATATATPSLTPAPTIPALAPGEIVVQKPWHASLLRPDYAVLVDGAIGTLQPRGRFVLALIAVGNDGAASARIPMNLFSLVDGQGNRYQPLPAASTAFLATYGRGQRGDLSMEEEIPAGGGNVSVPVIFDVPPNTHGLTLRVGGASGGWPVGAEPAPTAAP